MSHRLQVTIDDEQYAWLRRRSAESGASIAELVRRSVEESARGSASASETRLAALRASTGAWKDRQEDGAAFVERSRRRQ
ncbi:MAG: hypothetical protein QOF20_1190 [Acidimicrobiaceae bacterium]|jgi:hypothetical protein|nr:hypothetical protein [Acidimicrobiaceae bacterium]MDQ1365568.1 hypothetical protein [Acidimicrobiaceae bacterium]MDQ1368837.1 hypothetical protein [Acidimicrobiaceae bacterium]MDQ1416619.1 hypothetical protein [Acidimicrobiaceae bacterium]